jgi:hypothetical protein
MVAGAEESAVKTGRAERHRVTRRRWRPSLGIPQIIALAICIGFGLAFAIANVRSWELEDADAYWNAALRLRAGAELYPALANVNAPEVYRYAPWFAWLWVPLTYLPKELVQVGWSLVLLAAGAVALLPLVRIRSAAAICLAALLGGLLLRTASTGNVHALLIAALVYGAPRRSGPIWIGVAASLKFAPILYAVRYIARREWGRAGLAVLVAAALLAPALLYELGGYPSDPGESLSMLSIAGTVPWVLLALVCAAVALLLAEGRYGWTAASVAVIAAIPRLDLYDLTFLLVGSGPASTSRRSQPHGGGPAPAVPQDPIAVQTIPSPT